MVAFGGAMSTVDAAGRHPAAVLLELLSARIRE